jgi:hypothetical protein
MPTSTEAARPESTDEDGLTNCQQIFCGSLFPSFANPIAGLLGGENVDRARWSKCS